MFVVIGKGNVKHAFFLFLTSHFRCIRLKGKVRAIIKSKISAKYCPDSQKNVDLHERHGVPEFLCVFAPS